MTWRVIVGTLSMVVTMILLGYVAVTEQDRMANFSTAYTAREVEVGAALFETNCAMCHGAQGQGTGRGPALNTPELLTTGERLAAAGFSGAVEDYVHGTIASGRPQPSAAFAQYPERMPTWSQEFGGPLREDQIRSLVAFIMNWAPALANVTPEPTEPVAGVGTDITVELPAGDATAGEQAAVAAGCTACHISTGGAATLGPDWLPTGDPNGQGIGTRAALRLEAADYGGDAATPEQYLFESIVAPDAYIVPGSGTYVNASGQSIMPHNYGETVSAEAMADLIAYLMSIE